MFTYIQDFIPNNIIREVFLTMVLLFCKTSIHHISLTNMEYLSYFKNHVNIIIFGSKMLWFTVIIFIAIVYLLKNVPPPNARAEYYFFGNSKNTSKKSIVT